MKKIILVMIIIGVLVGAVWFTKSSDIEEKEYKGIFVNNIASNEGVSNENNIY